MRQGDIVPKNAFTNYDDLRKLIKKYNRDTRIQSADLTIDETLVDIRDAIAHGRVSSPTPSGPYQLLKFTKPRNNEVEVTFSVSMTDTWFKEQIGRFHSAVMKVKEANEKLQDGKL